MGAKGFTDIERGEHLVIAFGKWKLRSQMTYFSCCSFQTMQEHAAVFRTGSVLADGCQKIDDIYNQTEDLKVQTQLDFCLALKLFTNCLILSHRGHLKLHFAFENQTA